MDLKTLIEAEANKFAKQFAVGLMARLSEASLADIAGILDRSALVPANKRVAEARSSSTPSASGRIRRSSADIEKTLEKIVALLKTAPKGLRAEQIRASLNLEKKFLPKPISMGLSSGALTKRGQKRSTTYTVGDGKVGAAGAARRGSKKR